MRPKKHETTEEEGLFRARSSHMKHELVQLAGKLDWDWLDGEIATATGPARDRDSLRHWVAVAQAHLRAIR
jgi:hypothetical protein